MGAVEREGGVGGSWIPEEGPKGGSHIAMHAPEIDQIRTGMGHSFRSAMWRVWKSLQ